VNLDDLLIQINKLQTANQELRRQNQELTNLAQAHSCQRQRYQELFELAPEAYLVTDGDGKIQEANLAAASLFKMAASSLLGQFLTIYIPQAEQSIFLNQLNRLKLEPVQEWELRLKSLQREPFDAAVTVAVSRHLDGSWSSLRWLIRDITERKSATARLNLELERQEREQTAALEQVNLQLRQEVAERQQFGAALSQRELEFKALVENAPDVIARYDEQLRHIYINPAVEVATGIPFQDFIGKNFQELGMPEAISTYWNNALQMVFETNSEQEIEFQFLTPLGMRYYQSRLVPLATDGFESVLAIIRDITALKQVEAALLKSEERFRTSIDNMLDCFAIYTSIRDQSGKIVDFLIEYFNTAACESHFVTKELRIGKNLCELLPVVRTTGMFDEYVNVVETGKPLIKEALIYDHVFGGTKLTKAFDVRVVKLGDGFAAAWRDITASKQAEEALQESELRFRQLAENINDVFWMVTPESRDIIYISPAYEQIWGRRREDLYEDASTWIDAIHPEDRQRVRAGIKLQNQQIESQGYCELEYRIVRPDGEVRWIRDRAFGVHDQEGVLYRFVGVAKDITERQQAKKALQESELRFRQLAENVREVFWVITSDRSKLIYISPAYEEIWGRTCESLYNNPCSWLESIHPLDLDSVMAAFKKQAEDGFNWEYRILRPDGSMRWIHDRAFGVHDQNGLLYRFVGIAEDITERKLAEFEVCKALIKERELNELKSRFVSMTSHEFRTPLTTIQSSAELLERYYQSTDNRHLRHLKRIQNAVAQMTQMLDDILIIGEAEAGKLDFKPVPLDVVKFCRHLVEELLLSNQGAIAFNYQNNCMTPSQHDQEWQPQQLTNCLLLLLDEKLLRQILSNLLGNALKYSPIESTVQLDLICLNNTVVFKIKDSGIGIPLEDQSRLFEPFHRATNVGTIQGTGLGLAIVKQCVDLHRGEITVDSVAGGTTFTVKLPFSSSIILS
jgi:PAS domain S-box-containing protein